MMKDSSRHAEQAHIRLVDAALHELPSRPARTMEGGEKKKNEAEEEEEEEEEKEKAARRRLRELARSERGFVTAGLRRRVWPRLLGIDVPRLASYELYVGEHAESNQVELDVTRSLSHFPSGSPKHFYAEKQRQLQNILHALLSKHKNLHYYQGLHDIAAVLLVICDAQVAFAVLEQLCLHHIREFLAEDLQPVLRQLCVLIALIKELDSELFDCFMRLELAPFFAMSWIITWFSHDVDDFEKIQHFFDFFLASPPWMPLYVSAAIVIEAREDALKFREDADAMHNFLSGVVRQREFVVHRLLQKADQYSRSHPYEEVVVLGERLSRLLPRPFGDAFNPQAAKESSFFLRNYIAGRNVRRYLASATVAVGAVGIAAAWLLNSGNFFL